MKLKDEIEAFVPYNEQEACDQFLILEYLKHYEDILYRSNPFAHFSASCWVVNEDNTKVLMVDHNIYQSYSWAGGHADGCEDLFSVALKEAKEETGIAHLRPLSEAIFSLEILPVFGHFKQNQYISSHLHLNITYLFEASESELLQHNPKENKAVAWIPINQLSEYVNERVMLPIYQKLIEKHKKRRDN